MIGELITNVILVLQKLQVYLDGDLKIWEGLPKKYLVIWADLPNEQ